jgi:hypothetical protein
MPIAARFSMILEQVSGITYRVYLVPNPVAYTRDVS